MVNLQKVRPQINFHDTGIETFPMTSPAMGLAISTRMITAAANTTGPSPLQRLDWLAWVLLNQVGSASVSASKNNDNKCNYLY